MGKGVHLPVVSFDEVAVVPKLRWWLANALELAHDGSNAIII